MFMYACVGVHAGAFGNSAWYYHGSKEWSAPENS